MQTTAPKLQTRSQLLRKFCPKTVATSPRGPPTAGAARRVNWDVVSAAGSPVLLRRPPPRWGSLGSVWRCFTFNGMSLGKEDNKALNEIKELCCFWCEFGGEIHSNLPPKGDSAPLSLLSRVRSGSAAKPLQLCSSFPRRGRGEGGCTGGSALETPARLSTLRHGRAAAPPCCSSPGVLGAAHRSRPSPSPVPCPGNHCPKRGTKLGDHALNRREPRAPTGSAAKAALCLGKGRITDLTTAHDS